MQEPDDYRNPQGAKSFTVRVTDVNGKVYGEYDVPFTCGDKSCETSADAVASVDDGASSSSTPPTIVEEKEDITAPAPSTQSPSSPPSNNKVRS